MPPVLTLLLDRIHVSGTNQKVSFSQPLDRLSLTNQKVSFILPQDRVSLTNQKVSFSQRFDRLCLINPKLCCNMSFLSQPLDLALHHCHKQICISGLRILKPQQPNLVQVFQCNLHIVLNNI